MTFRTSPYNRSPFVSLPSSVPDQVVVVDVTLREGQQAAEVGLTTPEQIEIATALAGAGVPVIQAGYAGADDGTLAAIRQVCPTTTLAVLLVGWKEDAAESMRSALQAGGDIVSVLFRSPDHHLADLQYSRDAACARVGELVQLAKDIGWETVAFGPSFATLADLDHLTNMYRSAIAAGADVLGLADSMGNGSPHGIRFLVEHVKRLSPTAAVRLHMHNDFGLALANTLAGIEAGATWAEVTVTGLGERAGNCALEELVVALEAFYGISTGVRTERMTSLARLVERVTAVAVPPMKPVVGADCFANKLEIHVKAAVADPALMEPYDPALVGQRRSVRLGRGTGPVAVRARAATLGISLDDELIAALVSRINEWAVEAKRAVSDKEFREMIHAETLDRGR